MALHATVPLPMKGSSTVILSPCATLGIILSGKSMGKGAGCELPFEQKANLHTSVGYNVSFDLLNLGFFLLLISQKICSVVGKYRLLSRFNVEPLSHVIICLRIHLLFIIHSNG